MYAGRERLSLHSGGVLQGSVSSLLSARSSCLTGWRRTTELLFLSLFGSGDQTSSEGREQDGGAGQGEGRPA